MIKAAAKSNQKSSKNTVIFFKKLEAVYPYKGGIHAAQTDNGSEYPGEFGRYLKTKQAKRLSTYPRCSSIREFPH